MSVIEQSEDDQTFEEGDTDWFERGLCRGLTHLFFGDDGRAEDGRFERIKKARELCDICPVQEQCREYAITTNQPHGIWGGMSDRQRQRERKRRRLA